MTVASNEGDVRPPRRPSVGRSFYLRLEPDPVFATLHLPADAGREIGVLICPPFGWDELCCHRSLRYLADICADAGHPALRLDLPGAGDSGGSPRDAARVEGWIAALDAGARLLRVRERCERVVAFGIGLGGVLAYEAIVAGAPIDDLVLWAVKARGRALLRELRAFAELVGKPISAAPPDEPPPDLDNGDGSLEIAGFVVSAQTRAAIEGLDLTAHPLAQGTGRRALMLARDGAPVDRRLHEHLGGCGVEVTASQDSGLGAMMVDPQLSEIPYSTLERIVTWIGEAPRAAPAERAASLAAPPPTADAVEFSHAGATIRERPFEFEFRGARLCGVLTEPVSTPSVGLCAVLPNAGATRRTGPHRLFVDFARRWAALGVSTLRFDLRTIGDSDGAERVYRVSEFFADGFRDEVLAALDALEADGQSRFLLCGLCSGAYWNLHAALADERVRTLFLLNLRAIFWSPGLVVVRDMRRGRTLLRERSYRRLIALLIAERWRIARIARIRLHNILHAGRGGGTALRVDAEIEQTLDRLRERDVESRFVFGGGEPLYDELVDGRFLERIERWPNVRVDRLDTDDHVFRTLPEQREVGELLASAIVQLGVRGAPHSADGEASPQTTGQRTGHVR
jgi:alpha-beta hydrolase superfamily lysophospholipase